MSVEARGTIEITSHDQRVLLRPLTNGRTEIIETGEAAHPTGTRIVVTFGPELPQDYYDLSWSESAIAISQCASPPYGVGNGRAAARRNARTRATSPHWMDAEQLHGALAFMQPPETTVRQFVEQLDGCAGAKAGKIAAPFGKTRTCQNMSEADAANLLAAMQAVVRPVKPQALGPIGMDAYDPDDYDYERRSGSFVHGAREPRATIPFIVEAWVTVTNHQGGGVKITVLANRTPIVADVSTERAFDKTIALYGAGLGRYNDNIQVKQLGNCSIVLHITAPYIPLLSAGKLPDLSVFEKEIGEAIRLAFNRSRKRLPPEPVEPKPEPPPRLEKPAKIIKAMIAEAVPEIPAGKLRLRIEAEAKASGLSLDELTVLSPQHDPYRLDCPRGHELGKWFANQVDRFVSSGKPIHLRGLHYLIVVIGTIRRPDGRLYTNTESNWTWLQERAAKFGRWLQVSAQPGGRTDSPCKTARIA